MSGKWDGCARRTPMKQRMVKSGSPVYELIERHIKAVATMGNPATCVSLMEIGELRESLLDEFGGEDRDVRRTTNQLSNTPGFMWRKNILVRMPAKERNSKTRWAYVWNTQGESDTPPHFPSTAEGLSGNRFLTSNRLATNWSSNSRPSSSRSSRSDLDKTRTHRT